MITACRRRPKLAVGFCLLVCAIFVSTTDRRVAAGEITVTFDSLTLEEATATFKGPDNGPFSMKFPGGLKETDDDLSWGKFRPEQFNDYVEFDNAGLAKGLILCNAADKTVTDLHMKALSEGMTFKAGSSGGGAFPTTMRSDDGKEIWLSGGSIPPKKYIWALIEKMDQNKYSGKVTPEKPKDPEKQDKENSNVPKTGNSGTQAPAQGTYDSATGTISFHGGQIDFAQYIDRSTNDPSDSILGREILIDPMMRVGTSPDVPGAFELSDSLLYFGQSGAEIFRASLINALLIPDSSVPGFDSVIQARLVWEQAQLSKGSRWLHEIYGLESIDEPMDLFFRTNLLAVTSGLTQSGDASGPLFVAAVVSEPASTTLLILIVGTAAASRRGRRIASCVLSIPKCESCIIIRPF